MSRLLALEWDAKEARVVVARKRGPDVSVEQAFSIALPQGQGAGPADNEVGPAVAKALADHGLSRSEALVAVGRSSIELRFLSTPPVPPEELPDLVRFQALRQFTALGDDWPLDYVPLAPNADGGTNVLAAAISPEQLEQVRSTCQAAGVTLSRLVLRPFAAASLIKKDTADGKCRMIVDLVGDDADLTVMIGEQVIFPRTVRLPAAADPDTLARVLLAEGRRTMIAAQNQLGGRRVEEVIIFGDGLHHTTVKQGLEKDLSLPVMLVDPFDKVTWASSAKKPDYPGTFAPLLGLLADEISGPAHAIDFLHPRKRPAPPNRRRLYVLAGAAAAAVVLVGVFLVQWQLWALDGQIKSLTTEKTKKQATAKKSRQPVEEVAKLDRLAAGDIIWIEELARLSEQFPPADKVRVEELIANVDPKGGGKVSLNVLADAPASIGSIEDRVRDASHRVLGSGAQYDAQAEGNLKWRAKEDVTIAPLDPEAEPAPRGSGQLATKATTKSKPSSGKQNSPSKASSTPGAAGPGAKAAKEVGRE
jgi:Tfp pilus assembly PilM family ATPase